MVKASDFDNGQLSSYLTIIFTYQKSEDCRFDPCVVQFFFALRSVQLILKTKEITYSFEQHQMKMNNVKQL
jgi:hypothetical protein